MRPWRSWNDSHPQSFSRPEDGWNASLALPRKTAPLAISRDLSTHLLEVCFDFREGMNVATEVPLCPTPAEAQDACSRSAIFNTGAPLPSRSQKKRIETHNCQHTAPAAHSKALSKVLRNRPSPLSAFIGRRTSDRELALPGLPKRITPPQTSHALPSFP